MQLEELFDYKNRMMMDLLTSDDVVALLDEDLSISEAGKLAYYQVFPYEYMPDTVEHAQTFICFDVDLDRVYDKTYLSPVMYVWIFTHKSKMRLPEGGVRVDKLAHEIVKLLNGSRYYGLGELDLSSMHRFSPMQDYKGKVLTFRMNDFNKPKPNGHKIPSNRKRDEE